MEIALVPAAGPPSKGASKGERPRAEADADFAGLMGALAEPGSETTTKAKAEKATESQAETKIEVPAADSEAAAAAGGASDDREDPDEDEAVEMVPETAAALTAAVTPVPATGGTPAGAEDDAPSEETVTDAEGLAPALPVAAGGAGDQTTGDLSREAVGVAPAAADSGDREGRASGSAPSRPSLDSAADPDAVAGPAPEDAVEADDPEAAPAARGPRRYGWGSQGGMEPAVTRVRAAEEFRGRSERVWGMWLRNRFPGAADAQEQAPPWGQARGNAGSGEGEAGETVLTASAPTSSATWTVVPTSGGEALGGDEGAEGRSDAPLERRAASTDAGSVSARDVPAAREGQGPRAASPTPSTRPAAAPPQQVAHAVRVAVARGSDRVTVQLEPESLGKVQVELARDGSGVTAHFHVETPHAHEALLGGVGALRQALEAKGLVLSQVHVDLDDGSSRGRPQDDRGRSRRRRGRDVADGSNGPGAVEGRTETPPVAHSWRPWGFETRI